MYPEDPIDRLLSAACVADRDGFATASAALLALSFALRVRCRQQPATLSEAGKSKPWWSKVVDGITGTIL